MKSTTGPARNLLLATAAVPVAVICAEVDEVKFKSFAINGRLVDGPSTTTTSTKYVKKIIPATNCGSPPSDGELPGIIEDICSICSLFVNSEPGLGCQTGKLECELLRRRVEQFRNLEIEARARVKVVRSSL
jgi:hypothetical protein